MHGVYHRQCWIAPGWARTPSIEAHVAGRPRLVAHECIERARAGAQVRAAGQPVTYGG